MAYIQGYCRDSSGNGLSGVSVLIQGQTSGSLYTVMTDATGIYIRTVADGEVYLVTPFKGGYTFSPTSQTVNVPSGSGQVLLPDFTGTPGSGLYMIQGLITLEGLPLSGVLVTAGAASALTDASGYFYLRGLAPGSYTVQPVSSLYTFTPTSRAVTIIAEDHFNVDFTAASATALYRISGHIQDASLNPISGVLVSINDQVQTGVYTNGNGDYEFTNVQPGTYIVTPTSASGTFSPTSRTVTITSADSTGNNFTFTANPTGHWISGTITDGVNPIAGVVVTASNGQAAITNSSGMYTLWGLPDGTYRLTPVKPGYTFTPTYLDVTVSGANVSGKNFTGTASGSTHSISGTILVAGSPLEGVTVTAGSATAQTNSSGQYTIAGLANGTYTVTPSKTGYTFSPASRSVTVNGADVTAQDFTASASGSTYSISGHVATSGGVALAGVLIVAGTASALTDSGGDYTITGLSNGSYVVIPSLSGYLFSPPYRSATVAGANVTGQDFTAYTDTPSSQDLPYSFSNGQAVDASKIMADFSFLLQEARNISNANVKTGAGIEAAKIGSGLVPPRGNLLADLQYIQGRLEELEDLVNEQENPPFLPDAQNLEISGVGSSGSGGYVEIKAGATVRMYGRTYTTSAVQVPAGEARMAAESAYALRVSLVDGALQWTLVPLYGKAVGSGDTPSAYALVRQIGAVTDGKKFVLTAPTGVELLGARAVLISGAGAGQEFDVTYHNASTGLVVLPEALTTAPSEYDWVGLILDNPNAKDPDGELAGASTADSGLAAIIFTGEAGVQPRVMVQDMVGGTGRQTLTELPWSDRLDINKGTGAASTQTITFDSKHRPVKRVFGKMLLYDERTADPNRVSYQPIGAFSIPDASPASPVAKGLNIELFPGKAIIRVSDGHFAILKDDGSYDTAKSARFKLWLEH